MEHTLFDSVRDAVDAVSNFEAETLDNVTYSIVPVKDEVGEFAGFEVCVTDLDSGHAFKL